MELDWIQLGGARDWIKLKKEKKEQISPWFSEMVDKGLEDWWLDLKSKGVEEFKKQLKKG